MLAIKKAQREVMGEPAFVDRTIAFMKRRYLGWVHFLSDDELRMRVLHGIEKGRSYGLTWEQSLVVFVTHMLTIGPEFDKHPAIQRVLRDSSIDPPDRRMEALLGRDVSDDDWEESSDMCNPDEYWSRVRERMGAPRGGG
jgi:hypothetical protein